MSRLPLLLLLLLGIGCSDEPAAPAISVPLTPQFTQGSGVTRTDLAQSSFLDVGKLKRTTGDWEIELEAKHADREEQPHRLAAASDDHFHTYPDRIGWADVGDLEHYNAQLKEITDQIFKEGEYAA